MAAFDDVYSGSYTSTGAAKVIQIPSGVDFFEVLVQGNATGDTWRNNPAVAGVNIHSYWQSGMSSGTALADQTTAVIGQTLTNFVLTNGFTPVTSQANVYGPAFTGTLSNANPAVLTVPGDPFVTGDVVLLEAGIGNTSKQMLGITWSLVRTGVGTYTLNDAFDASALTAAGPVVVKKLLFPFVFTPYLSYIVKIVAAGGTILPGPILVPAGQIGIQTSYPHGLAVGETIRLVVPTPWGATALSGQQAAIASVLDPWTFTVFLTTVFSPFVFPSVAAAAAGVTWPQAIPIAEDASTFVGSFTDVNFTGIILGTSVVGPAGALVIWRAQHSLKVFTS